MNDTAKTGLFVLLAVVFLAIAWLVRPATPEAVAVDDTGERFFEPFDPLDAASLQVVSYEEGSGAMRQFRVAEINGLWSIPSHENYPADAAEHLAAASASVADLVKGPLITDRPGDHELYGVVDPLAAPPPGAGPGAAAGAGAVGVGTRVTIEDAAGKTLADFIIGKPVKDQVNARYVRVPSRDRVYQVVVDQSKLSTKFEDWIEEDLLQLNPNEIASITVNNYSVDELNSRIIAPEAGPLHVTWDKKARKWSMEGQPEGTTLDEAKLNEMKRALDDLNIVDVRRKPAGLGRELRAVEEMRIDQEAIQSLASKGYYIAQGDLVSNEGETIVGLETGVQYVLRFGEIALGDAGDALSASEETEAGPPSGANRYLFVTALFNPELVPAPEYQELPDVSGIAGDSADAEGEDAEDASENGADAHEQDELAQMLDEARKKIEADNAKLREEYEGKLEQGRKKVQELNDRFADWYYVISNDVYTKVRVTRADVVNQAATDDEASEPAPMMMPQE